MNTNGRSKVHWKQHHRKTTVSKSSYTVCVNTGQKEASHWPSWNEEMKLFTNREVRRGKESKRKMRQELETEKEQQEELINRLSSQGMLRFAFLCISSC